jgi:L-asparaginase II
MQSANRNPGAPVANPILAQTVRGEMVESRHRGSIAAVRANGDTLLAFGAIDVPVYARSAIKPLQALPLLESGAADRFDLSNREIALACASHNGEPEHVSSVVAWLEKIGLSRTDLECGSHWPCHDISLRKLAASGESPGAEHNNCSGKHCGFLTTAQYLGEPTADYIQPDHAVQRRVRQVLSDMSDTDLSNAPTGIDGCGIPVVGLSLRATAYAMARLASADDRDPVRRESLARIYNAFVCEPFMVAGSDRFCTDVVSACNRRALVKTGAEGVYCVALPALHDPRGHLGIALKIDDGASRAAETVTAHLLDHYLNADTQNVSLQSWLRPVLKNVAGRVVGHIEMTAEM